MSLEKSISDLLDISHVKFNLVWHKLVIVNNNKMISKNGSLAA